MSAMDSHDPDAWRGQLVQMLPRGRAWSPGPGDVLDQLLQAMAEGLAAAEGHLVAILEEADPRTALALLSDWERNTGLPDACFGQPDNISERQVAVAQRMTGLGGQDRTYFTALAAALGYVIEIEEYRPFLCGQRISRPIYGAVWRHVWRVHVLQADDAPEDQFLIALFRSGDRIGARLRGFGSIDLECLLRRHAPAHSKLLFAYPVTEPLFWSDFTQQ